MTQEATVYKIDSQDMAVIEVTRKSSCGDCDNCKGCSDPNRLIRVNAKNGIGAKVGERVMVESETKKVMFSAYIAYILPIILMVTFYFIPRQAGEGMRIFSSFIGLVIGVAICFFYSKNIVAKRHSPATIVRILRD